MFSERVLHEQISVHANESEEEDAGVEVGVKHISVAYTENISIGPLIIGITLYQDGKGAQESKVRDGKERHLSRHKCYASVKAMFAFLDICPLG